MHGWTVYMTDGPCADINKGLPGLKIAEQGLEKMFKYQFDENDDYVKILSDYAKLIGYDHFMETVKANSIQAKQRYQETHIRKRYIVCGTKGWPCTINATTEGWSTEFGMDGNQYEEVEGCTAQENFKAAYEYATNHYGRLITEEEYKKAGKAIVW